MSLMEEKTLSDHDINVRSIRQELQLLEEQLKKHGRHPETHLCDYIERQAAIDALDVLCQEHRYKIPGEIETYSQYNEAWQDALDRAEGAIGNLPPAQQDCTECSEYDNETHSCPKYCEVIRKTLAEAQPQRKKGKWINVGFMTVECPECKAQVHELEYANYCPNCGNYNGGEG